MSQNQHVKQGYLNPEGNGLGEARVFTDSVPRAFVHINLPLPTLDDTNEFISGLGSGVGKCHSINEG